MQVKLDINGSARIGSDTEIRSRRPATSGQGQEDELVLSQALLRSAEGSVRPEKIARAQEALIGSKYPPTEVIDQIARLLAIQPTISK